MSIHFDPPESKPILNQIIITGPNEPPFSEFAHAENCIIIAAVTQDEYDALLSFKAEAERYAVAIFRNKMKTTSLPALSRYSESIQNGSWDFDGNLCVGARSGK